MIELIENFQKIYFEVKLVVNEKQLIFFVFNFGICVGKLVDFIVIVGGCYIFGEDYFVEVFCIFVVYFEIWCVGGFIKNMFINDYGWFVVGVMFILFGMGFGNFCIKIESGFVDIIGMFVYLVFVFEKVGYFDEQLV